MRLSLTLSAAVFSLLLPAVSSAQTGGLEMTNEGILKANIFTGNVLTAPLPAGAKSAVSRILYAPSESDDAVYRAAISAAAGGAVVDYFDARNATPDSVLLSTYDAVHTWANYAFFDSIGFGNNLATFNDAGGHVVMGSFCTYTNGNSLSGAIMSPSYSPVWSPTGSNHFTSSLYNGDGTTCIYAGVTSFDSIFRYVLAPQGSGIVDGTTADGEIAHAYRPLPGTGAGVIVYSNGAGGVQLSPTGDWAILVANSICCLPGANPGTCSARKGVMGLNPGGYNCVNAPSAGASWNTTVDLTPVVGTSTLQTLVLVSLTGGIDNVPLLGYEMLALPPYVVNVAAGAHTLPVPGGTSGFALATQAARVELDSIGNVFIVLLNAQDVVIG